MWLKLDGNASPLAFQIPLLPVARGASPADTRVFQVGAFDPDLDELVFQFGDSNQFGGIMASKSSMYPQFVQGYIVSVTSKPLSSEQVELEISILAHFF